MKGLIITSLPAAVVDVALHLTCRRDARGRAGDDASARVDNGDSIASALSHGLVQLHLVLLESCIVHGSSSGRKKKRGRLSLVLQWRSLRRARGQR